ncbi:MAG TPA: hypothetical protein VFH39_01990 [Candidatus Saccharimonadales bacterium]|nr:hypothetical protein [Candidatus Saccharimonadales bacterium]
MAYRNREQYAAVIGKRRWLQSEGAYSVPDEAGSRVAILVPFLDEFVQDERDSRANFERQTAVLMDRYTSQGRDPYHVMGATPEDFEQTLADRSVPTVLVAAFGNFSAVVVPLSKDRGKDARYGYLDWLHLAGMATHLKLGKFVMLQCGSFDRQFNPPLGSGVVSSYANIWGAAGRLRYTTDAEGIDAPIEPVTTEDELSYDEVKRAFPLQRNREVSGSVPDPAYVAVRGVYNRFLNRNMPDIPRPEPIPHPDLRRYRS